MKRSVLDLYLTKVSQGDENYLEKLSVRLADRLLYVPLSVSQVDGSEIVPGVNTFFNIKGEGINLVPAFTHELCLREWYRIKALDLPYVSLLGYELCSALTVDFGLVINPASENSVTLSSDSISIIATFAKREDVIESLGTLTLQNAKVEENLVNVNEKQGIEHTEIEQVVELNESPKIAESKEILSERRVITLYDVVE